MKNLIHWQACDKWEEGINGLTGKKFKNHITRELVCDHPAIDRCWFWGGCSLEKDDRLMIMGFDILAKDGRRLHLPKIDPDCFETANIPEAEEWLKTL